MSAVKFVVRKDDPPLFLGKFTGMDVIIFMISIFPPVPLWMITRLPWVVCVAISIVPTALYIMLFRAGKPPGYAYHTLRFWMRPKVWRYIPQHADSLLGQRGMWQISGRPLPDKDGKPHFWRGVGDPRVKFD